MKEVSHIIVPDVHGRLFWKDLLKYDYDKVVFLGDYLDPYSYEWPELDEETLRLNTIQNFKEIIELKKENPKKVVLLLGNHDCGYAYGSNICSCRRDRKNINVIESLFKTNKKLFDLAYETTLGDKHFVFSHAGILKMWLETTFEDYKKGNVIDQLNNANQLAISKAFPEETEFGYCIGQVDFWRGGYEDVGSCVWSDIRSILQQNRKLYPEAIHIVGHTQLKDKLVDEKHNLICLDCRKIFGLTETGELLDDL